MVRAPDVGHSLGMSNLSRRAMSWSDRAFTTYFGYTVIFAVLLPITVLFLVVGLSAVSLADANRTIDPVIKLLALVVGASWALNRFFVNRTDAQHVRIECAVDSVRGSAAEARPSLLLYRIEVVNTGKVLLNDYTIEVKVESVSVSASGPSAHYELLDHVDQHPGGAIEPGSWSAVSKAAVIPVNVQAVRIWVEVLSQSGPSWTWHGLRILERPSEAL